MQLLPPSWSPLRLNRQAGSGAASTRGLVVAFPQSGRRTLHFDHARTRVICTYAVGAHRELGTVSLAASVQYGERWGWDVVASAEPELARGRPPSWAKVQLILDLLGKYEWVWCIDADALIVDPDRDVVAEIDIEAGPVWLAMHQQGDDPDCAVENAGIIVVRDSDDTRRFLESVWASEEFVDHNWWENAAILHLIGRSLEPPYRIERETVDARLISELPVAWNTVPGYIDCADAALHHHARADHDSFDRRLQAMASDLDGVLRRSASGASVPAAV